MKKYEMEIDFQCNVIHPFVLYTCKCMITISFRKMLFYRWCNVPSATKSKIESIFFNAQELDPKMNVVWYDVSPLGHNSLGKMRPNICENTGIAKQYTNHSLRATARWSWICWSTDNVNHRTQKWIVIKNLHWLHVRKSNEG